VKFYLGCGYLNSVWFLVLTVGGIASPPYLRRMLRASQFRVFLELVLCVLVLNCPILGGFDSVNHAC
jgi:hypothetical protein